MGKGRKKYPPLLQFFFVSFLIKLLPIEANRLNYKYNKIQYKSQSTYAYSNKRLRTCVHPHAYKHIVMASLCRRRHVIA